MDVEPNYGYIGGYGRKTFLDVSILNRYEVFSLIISLLEQTVRNIKLI